MVSTGTCPPGVPTLGLTYSSDKLSPTQSSGPQPSHPPSLPSQTLKQETPSLGRPPLHTRKEACKEERGGRRGSAQLPPRVLLTHST